MFSLFYIKILQDSSSLVARRAHNPKVGGSNPSPAPIKCCAVERVGYRLRDPEFISVTTSMLSWVRGLIQQVANLSSILNGPQVRILHSTPFWVDMQTG